MTFQIDSKKLVDIILKSKMKINLK